MAQIQPRHDPQKQQLSHQVAKTTTAVTLGGSLMVLSGLTLAATVIGLVLATPLLVIFSPVLVPAAITLFLILAGFVTAEASEPPPASFSTGCTNTLLESTPSGQTSWTAHARSSPTPRMMLRRGRSSLDSSTLREARELKIAF
ncbi:Oleosin Bn-V [Sesamum alatum]|uniref:Oleosin n=1 Tax=Sesamum alatum TaxID=300844 RepID=A0AAE1YRJ3_9LAMI|nr:Oleosin Bn-V [Sesamum alatum]